MPPQVEPRPNRGIPTAKNFLTYDKHGNILNLKRNFYESNDNISGVMDNLTLIYIGNQLKGVAEYVPSSLPFGFVKPVGTAPPNEYTFNKNGATKTDFNSNIMDIQYNSLNLPDTIQFMYGHRTKYSYDAAGTKHRVVHTTVKSNLNVPLGQTAYTPNASQVQSTLTTDYCGNIVYENNALKYILTQEGYITKNGTTPVYNYYLCDHLGNNRVVMSVNGSNYTAIQKTDYYPFGLPYANSTNSEQQPYKFGGKEYDEMHGLNWYDQVARPFGAVIPITPTPDPLSEKYYNTSPYVQWGNNPVKFIDPDGKDIILFNVTHRNNSGRPDGTRGQVSSATNAALKDIVGTKEGRAFFAQFAKAGDVVGGYTFEENGKYSSTNLTVYDYSWEKETGNIIPSGVEGSIGVTKDKATLKISSYGKDKNEIGETLTHETQLHGTYAGNQIEGKKGVPTESQDHKALKNKDTKHDGYNNYNSVRKQLETTDENYKKTFKEAEGHAQRNY